MGAGKDFDLMSVILILVRFPYRERFLSKVLTPLYIHMVAKIDSPLTMKMVKVILSVHQKYDWKK